MYFLRSIQLDGSDQQVYDRAATPGEWAIPGSFLLLDSGEDNGDQQQHLAFQHAFIGTVSFGYTSLVVIASISPVELDAVTQRLSQHLTEHCGAPSALVAWEAAREEVAFTRELCIHPPGTLISIERLQLADGIEERFREVTPPNAADHSLVRLWKPEDETGPAINH